MARLFAVTRSRGPAWDESRPMEEQCGWESHAAFMNALAQEGFVVLGGPLDDTPDVLLVVRARDAAEIAARLAGDPWTASGLLRLARAHPWTLRLGSLG